MAYVGLHKLLQRKQDSALLKAMFKTCLHNVGLESMKVYNSCANTKPYTLVHMVLTMFRHGNGCIVQLVASQTADPGVSRHIK